jgi:Raf kinase inhibitor-like YbhB/YbcL family protein
MKLIRSLTIASVTVAFAAGMMLAQQGGGGGGAKAGGKKGGGRAGIPAPLTITVAGYSDGGMIPDSIGCAANNQQKDSPKIDWTGAPAGTMSFAVIMHDTDISVAPVAIPDVLHWAIFDIPGTATGLPAGVPKTATLADGSVQLNSIGGMPGFNSPCPPAPTVHHYIIEVYALDAKLGLPATTSRADLLAALAGHTRAKGTYVGVYHV